MPRLVVLGNSGSGKSTLARRLAHVGGLVHLDLDTHAWEPGIPPRRLLATLLPHCTRMIFLNPGIDACVANAEARPWEPHKYPSKAAQDANLDMLKRWIDEYESSSDEFSLAAHRSLFDRFTGDKIELTSREAIAAFSD